MIANVLPFFCFISFFFFLSVLDIKHIKISRKQRVVLYNVAVLILICFAGLRWSPWEKGYDAAIFDYDTYHIVYDNALPLKSFISSYKDASLEILQMDIGYLLWNSIAKLILGHNYNLFLLLTNAILVVLLLKSLKRNNITDGLFFILFFYVSRLYLQYNFTLIRQAVAIVIVWCSLRYLVQRNLKKYYLFITLAISFHFSAIVCLFFPLIEKIRINTKLYFVVLFVLLVLGFLGVTGQLIETVLNATLSASGIPLSERLIKYLSLEGGSNILNFVEAIPFFYIAVPNKKELLASDEGRLYYNMLFCFVLLMAFSMNFSFITRFWQYMIFSYIYLLSFYYKKKRRGKLLTILPLYCLVYSVRYIMIWFYDVPYSCFLFHL